MLLLPEDEPPLVLPGPVGPVPRELLSLEPVLPGEVLPEPGELEPPMDPDALPVLPVLLPLLPELPVLPGLVVGLLELPELGVPVLEPPPRLQPTKARAALTASMRAVVRGMRVNGVM